MLKTLGIVEVAPQEVAPQEVASQEIEQSDSRLDAGQMAAVRFAGTTLIEWVLRRVTDSLGLDGVIAVLDRKVAKSVGHLIPPDIPIFDTAHLNSVDRLVAATERFPARAIVRVEFRMPFIDPVLIDRLISAADNSPECDYIRFRTTAGSSSSLHQIGLVAEWCRVASLRRTQQSVTIAGGTDLSEFVDQHSELLQTRFLQVPDLLDRTDIRLTVADQADLANVEAIYDALGPDQLNWQRIATLLSGQPAMREQMARLNREES